MNYEKNTNLNSLSSESLLSENTVLVSSNKELEEKIWCLELEKKRQSYNSDQIILSKKMMMGDCMSSISSGFVSYLNSNTGVIGNNYTTIYYSLYNWLILQLFLQPVTILETCRRKLRGCLS